MHPHTPTGTQHNAPEYISLQIPCSSPRFPSLHNTNTMKDEQVTDCGAKRTIWNLSPGPCGLQSCAKCRCNCHSVMFGFVLIQWRRRTWDWLRSCFALWECRVLTRWWMFHCFLTQFALQSQGSFTRICWIHWKRCSTSAWPLVSPLLHPGSGWNKDKKNTQSYKATKLKPSAREKKEKAVWINDRVDLLLHRVTLEHKTLEGSCWGWLVSCTSKSSLKLSLMYVSSVSSFADSKETEWR